MLAIGIFLLVVGLVFMVYKELSSSSFHSRHDWEECAIELAKQNPFTTIESHKKKAIALMEQKQGATDLNKYDSLLSLREQKNIPEFFSRRTGSISNYDYRDFAFDMTRVRLPNGRTKIELEKELPSEVTDGLTQLQVHTLYTVLSGLFEIKVGFVGGQGTLNCMYDIDSEVLNILNKLGLDYEQDKYDITYLSLKDGKDLRDWPTIKPKPHLSVVKYIC